MLQNIHDKAKGWLAYAIVFLISIPFALFGINSYIGGGDKLVAATVNGEEITVRELQNELLQQKQRLTSIFGKLPPNFTDATLKSQALEGLINQTLLRQQAENNGYRASDAEIFDVISNTEAFKKDGQFDPQTYEQLLKSNRRNPASYEAQLRKDIANAQMSAGITQSSFFPESEAAQYQTLLGQKRSFESYTLKVDDFKAGIEPSEDEIKAYYEGNSNQFMTEEKVKLAYVRIKSEDLAKSVTVSEDQLQTYYDENVNLFIDPEQRKISHVLFKVDGDEAATKKKAEAVYQAIASGSKTFEDAATNDSDDTFAAKNAGDLGFIVHGDMDPAFEKVAFSLETGTVSEPVKTRSGYELIKVTDTKPLVQKSFAQAKADVENNYRKEQADRLFQEQVEKLQTLAFENEGSLDPAAQAVGMEVAVSDWVSRKGGEDAFAGLPKVISEVFTETVLNEGKNSALIELNDTDVAVIRLHSKEEAKLKPIADVSDQIKQAIILDKTRKLVIEKGEAVLKKLQTTGNWSALSDLNAIQADVIKTEAVDRKSTKPSVDVIRKVFAMNQPEEEKTVFSNTILANGDYVLIGLNAVKNDEAKVDDAARKLFAQSLSNRENSAVIKALREEAEVEIIPQDEE